MSGTNYILVRRCCQCLAINDMEKGKCNGCGFLFINEASEEEKQDIYDKFTQK